MTWHESQKNIEGKSPRHSEVAQKTLLQSTLRQPIIIQPKVTYQNFFNYTLEIRNRDTLPQSDITFIINEIKESLIYYNNALHTKEFKLLLKQTKDTPLINVNTSTPIYATIILVTSKKDSGHGVAGPGGFKMFASSIDMEIEAANVYTAIHEAHHAYGSLSEFDQGSMSAFFGFMITESNDNLLRKRVAQQLINDTFVHMREPNSKQSFMAKNRNHLRYLYSRHPTEITKTLLSEGIPQDQIDRLRSTL